jgi:hypothetical protein
MTPEIASMFDADALPALHADDVKDFDGRGPWSGKRILVR